MASSRSVSATYRQIASSTCQARHIHSLQSILPSPIRVASPLATSSKITLDHPLHAPLPYTLPHTPPSERPDPSLPILLNYASDDELVNSLHSSPSDAASSNPFNLSINWTSTIDPALAYLSLRSRPAFTPFLTDRNMVRNIEMVYGALRPSGLHQRLVSDLLLRNPDPKLLAKIIDMDANGLKANQFDNLRSSLITAIYGQLPKPQRTSLSRSTNMRISKALVSQGDTSHITQIFHELYASTMWEPAGVWILLTLILHLTQHQAVEEALPLLQYLIRNQRLPSAALIGRGDPSHPQAPAITVLSIIIRSALSYKFYVRSRHLSSELLTILQKTQHHGPAWNLLLESCRVNLVGASKVEMEYVNEVLSGMAKIPGAPVLPKSTVNDYIGSVNPRTGAGFYFSMPEAVRPLLMPSNIVRLAMVREVKIKREKRLLDKLDKEIEKLPEQEWAPFEEAYQEAKRPTFRRLYSQK